jgi:hypothetical protein
LLERTMVFFFYVILKTIALFQVKELITKTYLFKSGSQPCWVLFYFYFSFQDTGVSHVSVV